MTTVSEKVVINWGDSVSTSVTVEMSSGQGSSSTSRDIIIRSDIGTSRSNITIPTQIVTSF